MLFYFKMWCSKFKLPFRYFILLTAPVAYTDCNGLIDGLLHSPSLQRNVTAVALGRGNLYDPPMNRPLICKHPISSSDAAVHPL